MKIIYNVIFNESNEAPSREGTRRVSALVSQIETAAHQWMQENYPDADLETRRALNTNTQGQIIANSEEEKERGQKILRELDEYIGQNKNFWLSEVL